MSAEKFWDGVAAKYAKSPIRDMPAYEATLERARSHLAPSDRVLELGCGTGSTAIRLAPFVAEMVASDCSGAMLEVGRRRASEAGAGNIRFVKVDVAAPPGGPYDVVMAFNLLHLLEDLEGALERIHGLLKPGGIFMSKTICIAGAGTPLNFRLMMLILPIMQFLGKAPFVRMRTIAELDKAIEGAGFGIVETGNYPARPPAHFIVCRKLLQPAEE